MTKEKQPPIKEEDTNSQKYLPLIRDLNEIYAGNNISRGESLFKEEKYAFSFTILDKNQNVCTLLSYDPCAERIVIATTSNGELEGKLVKKLSERKISGELIANIERAEISVKLSRLMEGISELKKETFYYKIKRIKNLFI